MKKLQQELLELCGMKLHETEWEAYLAELRVLDKATELMELTKVGQ